MRTCIRCRETKEDDNFPLKGGKIHKGARSSYCKPCHVTRTQLHRRQARLTIIQYAGGKCVRCGYNKCLQALEFHHRDPITKSFQPNQRYSLTDAMKKEIAKCDLLCANCHREEHYK